MKMLSNKIGLFAACTSGLLVWCPPANAQPTVTQDEYIAQLQSEDAVTRQQAAAQILRSQQQLAQRLLDLAKAQVKETREANVVLTTYRQANAPADNPTLARAYLQKADVAATTIHLLGQLRVEKAVPFLLENLRFVNPNQSNKTYNRLNFFPCLGALINIGVPALDPLLDIVEQNDSQALIDWSARILVTVLGHNAAIGYVKDRMKQRTDPALQQLKALTKFLQANPFLSYVKE